MDVEVFTIRFKNSEKIYTVPIKKIENFPKSYFMSIIHFNKQLDCTIEICTYEDFDSIFNLMMDDVVNFDEYAISKELLDYFGIEHPIYDSLIKTFNLKINTIHNLIKNQTKFIFVDNLDEYFSFKDYFSKFKYDNIVPFQYIKTNPYRFNFHSDINDVLLCGNGQLKDLGFSSRIDFYKNKKLNYFNDIKQTANKYNVSIPLGFSFDWLCGTNKHRLIDYFEPSGKYIEKNKFKYQFSENDYDCTNAMNNNTFNNEIDYIIRGINLVCDFHINEYKKCCGYVSSTRTNIEINNNYLKKYNNKNIITYSSLIDNISFDNFTIRESIHENKPVIYDKIIYDFNDAGRTTKHKLIEVFVGFINLLLVK